MTKQEILTKAIEKAVDGGWEFVGHKVVKLTVPIGYVEGQGVTPDDFYNCVLELDNGWLSPRSNFIFSHDFLKAFFGEEEVYASDPIYNDVPAWKGHACQMVISEDPIGYLSKFICTGESCTPERCVCRTYDSFKKII